MNKWVNALFIGIKGQWWEITMTPIVTSAEQGQKIFWVKILGSDRKWHMQLLAIADHYPFFQGHLCPDLWGSYHSSLWLRGIHLCKMAWKVKKTGKFVSKGVAKYLRKNIILDSMIFLKKCLILLAHLRTFRTRVLSVIVHPCFLPLILTLQVWTQEEQPVLLVGSCPSTPRLPPSARAPLP